MGVVLGIIALVVLFTLIVASVRMRQGVRAAERQQADVRARTGEAQHEDSLRRRAAVRSAPAEPPGLHTDE